MIHILAFLLTIASSAKSTYHILNEGTGVCTFIEFDDTECSGLKDALTVEQGYSAGACPSTYSNSQCSASISHDMEPILISGKLVYSVYCGLDTTKISHGIVCVETPSVDSQPMETYHFTHQTLCVTIDYDVTKCTGLEEELIDNKYISGPCPTSHSNVCDEEIETKQEQGFERVIDSLGDFCDVEAGDATLKLLCADARMKTFHKIESGLCVYVDVDDTQCPDMEDFLVSDDQGYISGPCPPTHQQSFCDTTHEEEMQTYAFLTEALLGAFCNWDFDDLTYDYGCEKVNKCPEECAKAIADETLIAHDEYNGIVGTGFCSSITSKSADEIKSVLPETCNGENAVDLCMPELYEKCVARSDWLICPVEDYGFPHVLKDCEPKTCDEWKEVTETGCAKDASDCVKDELQGRLHCTKDGADLPQSSSTPCSDENSCGREDEFCHFGESSLENEGECELCEFWKCDMIDNEKAKAECIATCGADTCTLTRCFSSCRPGPQTCQQLKNAVESPTGCGKHCNQCTVDFLNTRLACEGEDEVQSRIDGDSADSAIDFPVFMILLAAIYQF